MDETESKKIKIRLNNIDKVKKFANVASTFESDIDVIADRAVIDGKSILGLFSLDLTQDMYVRIVTDDINERRKFEYEMEEFK